MASTTGPATDAGHRATAARPWLFPSLMCADFDDLTGEVRALDQAGVDGFHLDVMDGSFVPNYALGLHDVEAIRRHTGKPIDLHLMVERPAQALEIFAPIGIDIVYVHAETDPHLAKTLGRARELGVQPGVALNPGTPVEVVATVLPLVERVLVMTVNPGFAAQRYLDFVDTKIERLVHLTARHGVSVTVDGAISPDRIATLARLGVDGFVLGTSSLFGKPDSYATIVHRLKELAA